MEIEGNMLLIILVGLSLAIAIVVVIIRVAVKKDSSATTGSLLSVLSRGRGRPAPEDTAESGDGDLAAGSLQNDELALPDIDDLDNLSPEPGKAAAQMQEKSKDRAASASIITVITDLFRGIFSRRKVQEEQKHEVKDIDEQLNQVLQESQNLGLDIQNDVRIPNISTLSESQTLRDIDKGMRDHQPALEMRQEPTPQLQSLEGLNPYTQGGSLDFNLPGTQPLQQESPKPPEQARPDLSRQPLTPKPPEQGPENAFKGMATNDAAQDLLSEIAAESVKEEVINMSIMKDLEGVPIACDELEKDLTGILGQISVNVKATGKKKKSA